MIDKKKIVVCVAAVAFVMWSLIPIYFIGRMSFMFESEISASPMHWIPLQPTLSNYMRMLGFPADTPYGHMLPSGYSSPTLQGILNSILVAVPVTGLTLLVAIPTGYAFGRYRFRGKNSFLMTILFSRTLPPVSIIVPYFFLFTFIKLKGTIPGLTILHLSITIPIIVWILIGFFATLPLDIEKAGRVRKGLRQTLCKCTRSHLLLERRPSMHHY